MVLDTKSIFKNISPSRETDVVCLNETKIDSTVSDGDIKIPGYNSYGQDRTLHGGGTLIYAADYLNSKKSGRFSRKDHEAIWIEVKLKKSKTNFYLLSV